MSTIFSSTAHEQAPFHLAIPVYNLAKARSFYGDLLGCEEGRSTDQWVDFNFFGHQLVLHYKEDLTEETTNPVDGKAVPIPHYGVVLDMDCFWSFSEVFLKFFLCFRMLSSRSFSNTIHCNGRETKTRIPNFKIVASINDKNAEFFALVFVLALCFGAIVHKGIRWTVPRKARPGRELCQ